MPDGNQYTQDFHAWAVDQAQRLRAAAQTHGDVFMGIDITHVIEEVQDLGRSDILRVQSLVRQALAHLIKIVCDPNSDAMPHWRREAMTFALDASDFYGRSYRHRIDMDVVWKKAQKEAAASLDQYGVAMPMFSSLCPVDLDWMMGDGFTLTEAEAMVLAAILPVKDQL
jgi:Domain of unknown function DUF29